MSLAGWLVNLEIIELMTVRDLMALTQLRDYLRGVIGWNPQWRKYRELVNCLDSSFFSSKWKRTHLSSLTPCLPGSAQVQVKCLSGQSCSQLRLPASCPYQVDIIDKIEKFSYCEKNSRMCILRKMLR